MIDKKHPNQESNLGLKCRKLLCYPCTIGTSQTLALEAAFMGVAGCM